MGSQELDTTQRLNHQTTTYKGRAGYRKTRADQPSMPERTRKWRQICVDRSCVLDLKGHSQSAEIPQGESPGNKYVNFISKYLFPICTPSSTGAPVSKSDIEEARGCRNPVMQSVQYLSTAKSWEKSVRCIWRGKQKVSSRIIVHLSAFRLTIILKFGIWKNKYS